MDRPQVIIALNGEFQQSRADYRDLLQQLRPGVFIGADGGARFLDEMGIQPDVVIGDFDSLTDGELALLEKKGVRLKRYPVEKDETDGELALEFCLQNGYNEITLIGSMGGRIDQQLANVFLLEYAYRAGMTAVIREPGVELGVIDSCRIFAGMRGSGLSLLPLTDCVEGVSIEGCKYCLDNGRLIRHQSRGVSNYITSDNARIQTVEGLLLYIVYDRDHRW